MRKSLKVFMVVGVLSIASSMTSLASWEQQADSTWKYSENGTYLTGWQWIDGNNDGVAECYYLDANGIMAVSTVVDSYTVNETGAWVANGVVQTKVVNAGSNQSNSGHQNQQGIPRLEDCIADVGHCDTSNMQGGDSTGLPPMQAGTKGSTNSSGVPSLSDIMGGVSYADVDNMEGGDSTGLPPMH